jgi:hypothetical protein
MFEWVVRNYRRWRDHPVAEAHLVPSAADAPIPQDGTKPVPVDRYTESLKATQNALHVALMGHSKWQQEEQYAVRKVADDSTPAVEHLTYVFMLVQTESGYTKMRPDEHREKTIVGVYRTEERADRARSNLRDVMRTRGCGSEHAYYYVVERMDLL